MAIIVKRKIYKYNIGDVLWEELVYGKKGSTPLITNFSTTVSEKCLLLAA
jgi:hypothetical protein